MWEITHRFFPPLKSLSGWWLKHIFRWRNPNRNQPTDSWNATVGGHGCILGAWVGGPRSKKYSLEVKQRSFLLPEELAGILDEINPLTKKYNGLTFPVLKSWWSLASWDPRSLPLWPVRTCQTLWPLTWIFLVKLWHHSAHGAKSLWWSSVCNKFQEDNRSHYGRIKQWKCMVISI